MLYLATFHLYYRSTNNKKVNIHSVSDSFHRIVEANSIAEVKEKLKNAYSQYDISSLDITECL